MENKLNLKSIAVAITLVFGLAIIGFAQNPPTDGGYKTIPTNDAEAIEAAEFAVEEQGSKAGVSIELGEVLSAARQTAQETNYQLCIEASVGSEDFAQFSVVVYKNLENQFSLKSWSEQKCTK